MNIFDIANLTNTEENSFVYAKNIGLISSNIPSCPKCFRVLNLERGKTRHGINGRWRCGNRRCRYSMGLFVNTIFDRIHIPLSKSIRLIYLYSMKLNILQISEELNLNRNTVSKAIKTLKENVISLDQNYLYDKIGLPNIPIEIDETHLISRRDNRGRILRSERYWVLGCICRLTKQCRFKLVRTRSEMHCINFIQENINPGSIIYSDMWRGYRNLNLHGYEHKTVNHSIGFINFENREIHTQNIERLWRDLKSSISKNVHSFEELQNNLIYYQFEKNLMLKTDFDRYCTFVSINKSI